MKTARLLDLGRRAYREVWALQHELHERVAMAQEPDTWIVVEHAPVVTLGRNAKESNLTLSRELLVRRGVDVLEVERGGDVTYHGPGQLVVYPICKLERFREIVPLVRSLETAVIAACSHFGVSGERWSEHAGVWVAKNQICAIGLAVKRMTSLHGLALNVSTDLTYDRFITPCGLPGRGVTSLSKETQGPLAMSRAKDVLMNSLEQQFDIRFTRGTSYLETAS